MFALTERPPARGGRALADLQAAVVAVRSQAGRLPSSDAIGMMLRAADALTSGAVSLLAHGGFSAALGMPTATMLQVEARRTSTDARMLSDAAGFLSTMPATASAFSDGRLSWPDVRGVVLAARVCRAEHRARIDDLVGSLAGQGLAPDELLSRVDQEVAQLRPDRELTREDRAIDTSFLAIQGRLDGSSSVYGEFDADSTATVVATLDDVADRPVSTEDEDGPSRAQQYAQALVTICEERLAGSQPDGMRPRPRLLAVIDLDELQAGTSPGARLLWGLAGRAPRLSAVATEALLCDAEVVPVAFRGGRPAGVGSTERIPATLRSALIARDGGCRFPACQAPVGWTDAHHIVSPNAGGATDEANCVLLCRRCHRLVHRFGWKIAIRPDGVIDFSRRGRSYASRPHAHLRT